ncbi:MAG: DUF72 domain-containing protein [Oceanospirillaceae bacterium]|nr:DUF72 domain-containing protein [Oceanospirillaceae bacterium]
MAKKIYLGLAQWHHSKWYPSKSSSSTGLSVYSNCFSSVEGNTSFYALPSTENLQRWQEETPDDFKFCFKFPKEISHKQCLIHCSRQVSEFLNRISSINAKLGVIWLQLDANFTPADVPRLEKFLQSLPRDFEYGVEVRHLDFFCKDEIERRYNQLLIKHQVNRVIFDTRSLFAHDKASDSASVEAFQAKPRVPTHVIATGRHPFVRVIVPMDLKLAEQVLQQWVLKVGEWVDQGLVPFMFFHTPDNVMAPQLAVSFSQMLHEHCNDVEVLSIWLDDDLQSSLF